MDGIILIEKCIIFGAQQIIVTQSVDRRIEMSPKHKFFNLCAT